MAITLKTVRPRKEEPSFIDKLLGKLGLGGDKVSPKSLSDLASGEEPAEPDLVPDWLQHVAATGVRVAGPMIGGSIGGALGGAGGAAAGAPALGVGAIPGAVAGGTAGVMAGGAAGGSLAEALAQKIEPGGRKRPINLGRVAVSGAIGAVPGSSLVKGGAPIASALKGVAMGGAGVAGYKAADGVPISEAIDPRTWSMGEVLTGPVAGGVVGGTFGRFLPKPKTTVDPLEDLVRQATSGMSAGTTDVGRTPLRVPPDFPRVVKKGGLLVKQPGQTTADAAKAAARTGQSRIKAIVANENAGVSLAPNEGGGGVSVSGFDAEAPAVTEVKSKLRGAKVSRDNYTHDLEVGIKDGMEIGKGERAINTSIRKAENKLNKAEESADLANTRNQTGTDLGKAKAAEAKAHAAAVAPAEKADAAFQDAMATRGTKFWDERAKSQALADKTRAIEEKQAAAQAEIDSMRQEGYVPQESITERFTEDVPGGQRTGVRRFVPPNVEKGEPTDIDLNNATNVVDPAAPKVSEKVARHTIYATKEKALEAAVGTNAIGIKRAGRGQYVHVYPEGKAPSTTAKPAPRPAAPRDPNSPAGQFESKVDEILKQAGGSEPDLPIEPPPAPAPTKPKGPSGGAPEGAPFDRSSLTGKTLTKAQADKIAKDAGGYAYQYGPRKWTVKFADEDAANEAARLAHEQAAVAREFPTEPPAPPAPKAPKVEPVAPAPPAPDSPSGMGDLTMAEARRLRDLQPARGVKRTAAEAAEYLSLHRRSKGELPPEIPELPVEAPISKFEGLSRDKLEAMPEGLPDHPDHPAWVEAHDAADEAATIAENAARAKKVPEPKPVEPELSVPEFAEALAKEGDKPLAEVPFSLGSEVAKPTKAVEPAFDGLWKDLVESGVHPKTMEEAEAKAQALYGEQPRGAAKGAANNIGTTGKSAKFTESENPMMDSLMNDLHGEDDALPQINPEGHGTLPPEAPKVEPQAPAPRKYRGEAGQFFTQADEAAGYPKTREALAGYSDAELVKRRGEEVKATFDRMFGHNAKKFLKLIDEEIANRPGIKKRPVEPKEPLVGLGDRLQAKLAAKKAAEAQAQTPVEPPVPVEPPAPVEPKSAIPVAPAPAKLYKSQLEAAGEGYGAVKAAKAAGEKVPEEGRRAAGSAAARIKGEAMAGDGPDFGQLANLPPEEQNKILAELVKKAKGQKGEITNEMMIRMGLAGAGALTGAAVSDDPLTGALVGAGAGFYGPAVARALINHAANGGMSSDGMRMAADSVKDKVSTFVKMMPDYQRFALLMDTRNLPMNMWLGPWGSSIMAAIEHTAMGDQKGRNALRLLFNPKNFPKEWKGALEEAGSLIANAEERTEGKLGQAGPEWFREMTSMPGKGMTAGDVAARNILVRAGFSPEEARAITLTSEPYSPIGKGISALKKGAKTEGGKTSWFMNMALPFYRTATNQFEQGMDRMPVLGLVWNKLSKDIPAPLAEQMSKQGVSLGVAGTSYVIGSLTPESESRWVNKFLTNFGGQYGLVASGAFMLGQANKNGKSKLSAMQRVATESIPQMSTDVIHKVFMDAKALTDGDPSKLRQPFKALPQAFDPREDASVPSLLMKPFDKVDKPVRGVRVGVARPTTTSNVRLKTVRPRTSK